MPERCRFTFIFNPEAENGCYGIAGGFSDACRHDASEGRSCDEAELKYGTPCSRATGIAASRQDLGEHGAVGRADERPGNTAYGDSSVDPYDRVAPDYPVGNACQHEGVEDDEQAGRHSEKFSGMTVDGMAGEEGHAEVRYDLGQSDKSQRERIPREFVDVPSGNDGNYLIGQYNENAEGQQT